MNEPLSIFDRMYIVDNFYTDPDQIRNYVLSSNKNEESNGNYAGVMSVDSFLTQEHLDIISTLIGNKVIPSTSFTGKFRFTKEKDEYQQDIHFDPYGNSWAGVVYLTPNIEDTDGTIFWKHKKTGLESIPRTLKGINQYGWKDTDDLKTFLTTEGVDHSCWNKTMVVPYKYNRMVIFRPWMFHSPGSSFGDTFENCRLIQTFFWSDL
jgi:hypothetical protein